MEQSTPATQAETALGLSKGGRGRKNSRGDEEVPKYETVKEKSAELMKLLRRQAVINTEVNEAFTAVAERSNTKASHLRKLFKASLKGRFVDARNDADQQSVMFEMVGEVAAGPKSGE